MDSIVAGVAAGGAPYALCVLLFPLRMSLVGCDTSGVLSTRLWIKDFRYAFRYLAWVLWDSCLRAVPSPWYNSRLKHFPNCISQPSRW